MLSVVYQNTAVDPVNQSTMAFLSDSGYYRGMETRSFTIISFAVIVLIMLWAINNGMFN